MAYIFGNSTTEESNRKVIYSLVFIALYALIAQTIFNGFAYGIKSLLIIATSCFVAYQGELLATTHFKGISKDFAKEEVSLELSLISGLIFALIMPVGVPLFIIAIGSFVGVFLGKVIFGGQRYNVFNPAAVARIFVMISWSSVLVYTLDAGQIDWLLTTIFNISYADTVAQATPISQGFIDPFIENDITKLLIGDTKGAIGEVCRLPILITFIYLAVTKSINVITPIASIVTLILLSLLVLSGTSNMFEDAILQIFIGGYLFALTFMITDPSTTPSSSYGKVIFGIGFSVVVVFIRSIGSAPEGVIYGLLFMNMLTPLINSSTNKENFNLRNSIIKALIGFILILCLGLYLNTKM